MTRARSLSLLANANAFTVSGSNNVGIGSTLPDGKLDVNGDILVGTAITIGKVSGIISATSYRGDGSQLTGVDSSNLIDSGDTNRVAANTSGIVVTGIATVTGDMNVGGVLTYDDVTNVDSVGIITARSHVSIADSILHTGDTDTSIRFPAANTFTVETGGSEALRVNSNQRLLVGHTAQRGLGQLEIEGTSFENSGLTLVRNVNSTGGTALNICKTRGSKGGTTSVQDNDVLGGVNFRGADGANLRDACDIRGEVDGSPSQGTDMPGRLVFRTSADGSSSPTERLRIDSSGNMGLNATPEDWESGQFFAFQFGKGGAVFGRAAGDEDRNGFVSNCYHDSAGWKYIASSAHATRYDQNDGNHIWNTAGTGTADAAVSFSESARIDTSGRLLISATSARTNFNDSSIETRLQIEVAGNDDSAALSIISNAGTSNSDRRSGLLVLGRTRGTSNGSNTVVVEDDAVGMIEFKGMDGTSFTTAALIKAQVDGSVGTDDMPGRLVFSTTADGAAVPTERLQIDSSGNVIIKNSTSGGLYLKGIDTNGDEKILIGYESGTIVRIAESLRMDFGTTSLEPVTDNSVDLGQADKRWKNIYSADLQLSNEGSSNDVDGTWGQYTIQEGENDLFLLNRRNGKTYKFVLEEVN